jgi:7-carboxy-7-deazaguanine synthase
MYINEIFTSISGEVGGFPQGALCTFVRLQGCNLKCTYCDTEKAQSGENGGYHLTTKQVAKEIKKRKMTNVVITGGEPLLQSEAVIDLFDELEDNFNISIETNGTIPIDVCCYDATIVMDYKLKSSGHSGEMNLIHQLTCDDWVKFVIQNIEDFNEAVKVRKMILKKANPHFAFSLAMIDKEDHYFQNISCAQLYSWLLEKKIYDAVINVQLHKLCNMR